MFKQQPMKMAAAEALWEGQEGAPFSIFAVGDVAEGHNDVEISVPGVLSFLADDTFTSYIPGINELNEQMQEKYGPGDYRPNIPVAFWGFRWMIGFGMASFALGTLGLWLTRKKFMLPPGMRTGDDEVPHLVLFKNKALSPKLTRLYWLVALWTLLFPLIANSWGWIFTETGRQPWAVFGVFKTADAVSPGVSQGEVITSLIAFTLVYAILAVVEVKLLVKYIKAKPAGTQRGRPQPAHHDRRSRRRRRRPADGLLVLRGRSGTMELHDVWFVLIAVLWIGYFFLEGFDFGIGVLTKLLARDRKERRVLINTIGPVWDGNEVWLLSAGGATFAAFPDWYATLFSGFYLPLLIILLCLIVRGVAFEYRAKRPEERWQSNWEHAIFWTSLIPAVLWGVAFGNIVRGVKIDAHMEYVGGFWDLLNPFALLGGAVTLALFTFHGAVFAALKTVGDIRVRARKLALRLGPVAAVLALGFLIWTQARTGDGWSLLAMSVAVLALVGAIAAIAATGRGGRSPSRVSPSPPPWRCSSWRSSRTSCRPR